MNRAVFIQLFPVTYLYICLVMFVSKLVIDFSMRFLFSFYILSFFFVIFKSENSACFIQLKFDADFNEVLFTAAEVDAFVQTFLTEYGHFYQDIYIVEGNAYEGCMRF